MPAIHHPDLSTIPLETVLQALADPIRLTIVRNAVDSPCRACGDLCPSISKSRLSHHFRVLREAGVIRVEADGTRRVTTLRKDELDDRFPGLLDAILSVTCPKGD